MPTEKKTSRCKSTREVKTLSASNPSLITVAVESKSILIPKKLIVEYEMTFFGKNSARIFC